MFIQRLHFSTIDSTNKWAKEHAHELDKTLFTCITTDEQTAGYGRQKRAWEAFKGNLIVSFCFSLKKHIEPIAMVLGLAIAKALETWDIHVKLKWPNDIWFEGKKLGGILAEILGNDFIVVGLGFNTVKSPDYAIDLGGKVSTKELLDQIIHAFIPMIAQLEKEGFAPFQAEVTKRLAFLGEKISFKIGEKNLMGILHSIQADGTLCLQLPSEGICTFSSGEIHELRPEEL